MQGSDLDVFDVRLEQQMPARWQVAWNVLRSLPPQHRGDHKVRTVWSSTPGGRFQKALPAARQPRSLCWIIKSLEGSSWSWCTSFFFQCFINNNAQGLVVGCSAPFFFVTNQKKCTTFHIFSLFVCQLLKVCRSERFQQTQMSLSENNI